MSLETDNSLNYAGLAEVIAASSWEFSQHVNKEDPEFLETVWQAVTTFNKHFPKLPTEITSGRQGGVLVIGRRGKDPVPPLVVILGEDVGKDPDFGNKLTKHIIFALTKFAVLIQNPLLLASDQRQSDDVKLKIGKEEKIPAGAITLESGWSVGFSGLPTGGQDVYIAMLFSYMIGIATFKDLDKFGLLSDNGLWSEALNSLTTGK